MFIYSYLSTCYNQKKISSDNKCDKSNNKYAKFRPHGNNKYDKSRKTFDNICFNSQFIVSLQKNKPLIMANNYELTSIPQREIIQSFLITSSRQKGFNIYEKRIVSKIVSCLQPMLEGEKLIGRIEKNLFGDVKIDLPITYFTDGDTHYRLYQDALKDLASKGIEYEDENIWMFCNIIQSPKVIKNRGLVTFSICKEMVDVFLNFSKGYSRYILEISISFKRVSTARLYELISNQKRTLTYRLDKLKTILDPENKYPRTCNFMQRIVEPSKKELDESESPYTFTYEPIKHGNTYIGLKITPIHRPEKEPNDIIRADAVRRTNLSWMVGTQLRNFMLKTCGFTQREIKNNLKTLEDFCNQYPEDAMEKIMDIWNRALDKQNPKGYFIRSLQLEIEH